MGKRQSVRGVRKQARPREFVRHPLTALMLASGLLPGWSYANTIVTDGRTGTSVVVDPTNAAVTDITTSTVRGKAGFNSFNHFVVDSGNTVNVHVPGSATHLVNLVHDSRAEINGTLNGLKDGKIGGNIIFADPHGFVVGASGVVNVGSLTVTTPTQATMDEMLRLATETGVTAAQSDAYLDRLANGQSGAAALTTTGDGNAIVISGMVNANGAINLHGASVLVGASAALESGTDVARAVFDSTVNTSGVSIGAGIVRTDGGIAITASNNIEIAGELAALMADDSGGSVRVAAVKSVVLKGDAVVSTAGSAGRNSGNVLIEAPSIRLEDNALIDTRAQGAGNSGSITLNALSDISCTFCDPSAEASTLEELKDGLAAQADPWLAANLGKASISIGEDAVLDAGHTDATKAGDVTLEAFAYNRQLAGYAKADADISVDGTLIGRDIRVAADSRATVARDILGSLLSTDALKADIDRLTTENGWTEAEAWGNVLDTLLDPIQAYAGTTQRDAFLTTPENFSELTLLVPNLSAYIAQADATVKIGSSARLLASRDLTLAADGERSVDSSTWKIPGLGSKIPFGFDAAYGQISGLTSIEVLSGAELLAARDLSAVAHSQNTLKVTAAAENSVDSGGNALKTMGLGFGMAMSDIETRSIIRHGAQVEVGRDATVAALTEQTLNNTVTFNASGDGATGGPAVALSLLNSKTRAEFSADLDGARNLNLTAANLVHQQVNSVNVSAGSTEPGYLDKLKTKAKEAVADPVTDYLGTAVKNFFGIKPKEAAEPETPSTPTESKFRLASALAVSLADHQVEAVLGAGNAAPELNLTGDLSVQALQKQFDLHNVAESTVNASAKRDDGTTDGAKVSLSVAAVYSELNQKTHAIVGDGSQVTAARIGVGAQNDQALNLLGLDRWSSLEEVYANLKLLAEAKQGIGGKLATQYANSTGEADKLGMAGSLSILQNRTDTTAWVGDNVNLTATAASGDAWTSSPLAALPAKADEEARIALRDQLWTWDGSVAVRARNSLEQLAISGNLGSLFGVTSDGGAVGAALNIQLVDNRAVAGIGARSTIVAERLDVSALQDELIIGLSPSAGKGASVAGNGSVVVSVVDSTVHASVHSSTSVEAGAVNLDAEHRLGLWSASGALAASENVGIGAGVAVNVVNTDVYALVGDNNLRSASRNTWRPESMGAGVVSLEQGAWLVDDLSLSAQSSGQSGAFAIAGALARSEQEQEQQDQTASQDGGADKGSQEKAGSLGEAIKMSLTNGLALLTGEIDAATTSAIESGEKVLGKVEEYWGKLKGVFEGGSGSGSGSGSEKPSEGFSLAAAASGSVNYSAQRNRAHLGNIVLDPRDSADGSNVEVLSLNQTHQFSASGAGALTMSGGDKSKFSSALSGAVAYNHLKNLTEAQVRDVILNDNDQLLVRAASGGDQIALGLGMSVATGGETNVAVALSGSAGVFENRTRASVIDTVIAQRSDEPGRIAVNAYDRSRALLGGGAFAVSTDKGGSAGGSLVVGVMSSQLEAEWLGSTASDFDTLEVKANSASRVLAGAIGAAVSTGQESGAGAGSLFVVVMANQVKATVDQSTAGDSSLAGGDVTVAAASVSGLDALDAIFAHDGSAANTLSGSGLDLSGTATTAQIQVQSETDDSLFSEDGFDTDADDRQAAADTTTRNLFDNGSIAGEAVLGIAGSLAATGGKAAVGGAFGVVYSGSEYAARVANTDIDVTGDVRITARNETDVLAAAIGAAGAQDVAVSGSATALIGRGAVSADLDMTGRTLRADDLTVEALRTGGFYALAGSISASSNTAAVGGAFSINDMQQGATATVNGGAYELTGDAVLNAAQQSRIITAALSGAVSASGTGVGAAMTYNRIADTTEALLSNAALSARNLDIAASQPNLGASIWSLAFNLAAGGGTAGVGAGVAVNLIDAERSASIAGSTVNLTGNATMASALDGEIWSIGIDAAGGGTAGVGGSFAVNNINGKDEVSVVGSTLTSTGTSSSLLLDARAGNGITIASLAGSVTGGGTAAVGLAASVNRIAAERTALVSGSTLDGFADASLRSGVEQTIYSIAVAGGGAGTVAVNGATTTNILAGTERAAVTGSNLTVGQLDLSAAEGSRTIWGLGAVMNGAGTVAVGASNVNSIILAKRIAEIDASTLNMAGALSLASGGDALIRSAAVGGGGAGTAAVGASVAINVVDGEETARLSDSTVSGATSVIVEVTRGETDIKTLAGNVQGSGTGAGAGAVAVSTVSQTRQAVIQGSQLALSAAAPVRVEALSRARIDTLALSGAGAGAGAVVFSNTSNNIDAKTHARVINSSGNTGAMQVLAQDASTINSLSGGAAVAGSVAVGVASAVNRIANDIEARLSGNRLGQNFNVADLRVDASSDAVIRTLSVSGGFSGTVAVNGGVSTSFLDTGARALIDGGARVVATNNVAVVATNRDVINSYAGVVAGSGNAAVSGLLTVNLVQSETEAAIRGATTRVTALAQSAMGATVSNGNVTNAPNPDAWADAQQFNPVLDLRTGTESVRGIAVRATSLQQVGQVSASAAVTLVPLASASVGGLSNTSVLGGSTLAAIDQAQINQDNAGANLAQRVSVGASSSSYSFAGVFNAALSLGAAAVAATVDTGVVSRDVTSRVRGANLTSRGQTSVQAASTLSASNVVTSASGAIVGLSGSGAVLVIESSTEALVDQASRLNVGGLLVRAQGSNSLSPNAVTLAGGAVGAGAGLAFGYNGSTVRAWLGAQSGSSEGRTAVTTNGAVAVEADSLTRVVANTVSAAGGGAGVAGSINVMVIENVTEAGAGKLDLATSGSRAASLTIDARDRLNALSNAGSAAVGGLSLGASANVLVANNATRAMLLDSQVFTSGNVDVLARRESDVQLYTVTGGIGGSVALGGSVGLIMLGSGATRVEDTDAMDELNKDGTGTLFKVDQFTSRDLNATEYQTTEFDAASGEYRLVTRLNTADVAAINAQGDVGSTSDRLKSGTTYRHETLARVQAGNIQSQGTVRVEATDAILTRNLAGSAQLSGTAAVGGVAAITLSNARVTAELKPVTLNSANTSVRAETLRLNNAQPAVKVEGYTGSAGFAAGLGAGVGIAVMKNLVSAEVGGQIHATDSLSVNARDALDLDVRVLGGQIALGGAAGIVVAVGDRSSTVAATVANSARLSADQSIGFSATSEGSSLVKAQGASGGLLFGVQAAVANARDASQATMRVGQGAHLTSRNLELSAVTRPRLDAEGLGVAVGGKVAMGGTILNATATSTAYLDLEDNTQLSANQATLRASVERNGSHDSVKAHGQGVVGGLGLSVNAVVARATNNTHSRILTSGSSRLVGTSAGEQAASWVLSANTDTRQRASTAGLTLGLLSVGAQVAEAGSTNLTQAQVNSQFSGNLGSVRVAAIANNDSEARSKAGQGGLVAGAASVANTWDNGRTEADWLARGVGGASLQTGAMVLDAWHTSRVNGFVDSTTASLVGVSGAYANNTVDVRLRSNLLSGSFVEAGDYAQSSLGRFIKADNADFNVKSGSGGVIDAPAARSITTVRLDTQALVGTGARLGVVGDWRNPGHLVIQAFNDIYARDRAKLDAGAAIAVTRAESRIDVQKADSTVTIGENARLFSVGNLTLASSTEADVDARTNTKAYGAAGAAQGISLANVKARHDVNIQTGASLWSYGDVRLHAGADASGRANRAKLVARTDLWNNTAFPVETDPIARAIYDRTQSINLAAGALIETVSDVYAYAEKGFGDLTGKGIGKDLYREAAATVTNAFGSLVGAGEVSFDIEYNFASNISSSDVVFNGDVRTGVYNHQRLVVDRLEFDPVTGRATPVVSQMSDGMTFSLVTGEYVQMLSQREEQLFAQLRNYGLSEIDRLAIEAELRILQQRMRDLYREMGGVAEGEGSLTFDRLPRDIQIQILVVDPIIARPGNIFVKADRLTGQGNLRAPGDATITIENKSAAFLQISNLEIPNREGGQLLFNGASMTDRAAITSANRGGVAAQFASVIVAANSPAPQITVTNSYNPATGGSFDLGNGLTLRQPAPDININGAVRNLRGNVELTANYGSVYINGDVRAQSISISAGRDFVLNAASPFFHAGGDPASNVSGGTLRGPEPGSGVVAGNNVIISAQYLNINGLLQSGVADWSVVINDADFTSFAFSLASLRYNLGVGERYYQMRATNARTGTVGYSFDFQTGNIVLDTVEVGGGYMELTGHIMSTGNGQINILDGYSRVNVVNNTARTLQISGIDLGSGVEGTLRINDINFTGTFKGNDSVTSTIYTRVGNNIQVYRGASNEVSTNPAYLIATHENTRTTTYDVRSGRSYVWLTGQDYSTTRIYERYVDKFWSLVQTGQWDSDRLVFQRTGPATPIPGAEYMGNHVNATWTYNFEALAGLATTDIFRYIRFISNPESAEFESFRIYTTLGPGQVHTKTTTVTTEAPISTKEHWTSCAEHFIWCQITRYHERETTVTGYKDIVRNTVRADLPINIRFIGHDTGQVTLSSAGNMLLAGSVFNETGTTTISANQLLQASEEHVVAARDLTLNTRNGIGSDAQSVGVQLTGGALTAANLNGNVHLRAVNGGVHLNGLSTFGGDINLSAQGNITAGAATVIAGHAINLTSTQGSIGAIGSPLRINTNNTAGEARAPGGPALFTASAIGNVAVEEISGDLALNTVTAGGDVWIRVANGDLVDANTDDSFDDRSLDEMRELWDSMRLTGSGAAEALEQQKTALVNAGNARYSRYWQLRNLRLEGGEVVTDAYDPDFQAVLSPAQVAQLQEFYEWTPAQVEAYRLSIIAEYHALHGEFGGTSYDSGFAYQLSAGELASVQAGASWTEDQLMFSISRGLLRGEGGGGSGKVEALNIDANNITLVANRVGSTLAEDVVIDLSGGFVGLTTAQRAALASAEADDIILDPSNPNIIRIIQREDVDINARGTITVTAQEDVFLGGTSDFNIFNVRGDRIEIKTDGSILSANGSQVVVTGNDVVLDAGGVIGTPEQALHLKVAGILTARAQSLGLAHQGDLTIDYLLGRNGIALTVDQGNLFARDNSFGGVWQEVQHIAGGDLVLRVDGQVGTSGERINIGTNPTNVVNLDITGDAWLGGVQGLLSTPGALRLGQATVGGRLDLNSVFNLQQTGDWSLGSLVVDVQNHWLSDAATRIQTRAGIIGTAGGQVRLGNLTASNANAGISLTAASLEQNAEGLLWQAGGLVQLRARGDVGSADRFVGVSGGQVNARSELGNLYLRLQGPILGGALEAISGGALLQSSGDVAFDRLNVAHSVRGTINGSLSFAALDAGQAVTFEGDNLSAQSLFARNGDLSVDLVQLVIDAATVNGRLDVIAGGATLGEMRIAQTARILASGNLQLDSLSALDSYLRVGTAQMGTLDILGNLDLGLQSNWSLQRASVTGDMLLMQRGDAAADGLYSLLEVAGRLDVSADGQVRGGDALVNGQAIYRVGSADIGRLRSTTADLSLWGAGRFAAASLETPDGNINLEAGSADVGNAEAGTEIDILTHGDLVIGRGRAGTTMALTSSSGSAGNIRYGQRSAGAADLEIDHLYAAQTLRVEADGDVIGGNAAAEGEVFISGYNLDLDRTQSYASDVQLRARNDIHARLVKAFRDIGIIAGGNLVMEAYEAQRLSLSAGRDLLVGLGGNLTVSGYAEAGRDVFFDIGGNVDLLGIRAGRDVTVSTRGLINITEIIEAGGKIDLRADGGVTVGERMSAGGNIDVLAGGAFRTPLATAGGHIQATSLGMSLGDLDAATHIGLRSGRDISLTGTSRSGSYQDWRAEGTIEFERLLAGGQALLDSLLDTRGSFIQADQGIVARAGWRAGIASPAEMRFVQAVAPSMQLWSGQLIQIDDASIGQTADLHAQQIELYGRHTGEGMLRLRVQGLNNEDRPGDRFRTRLDAAHVVVDYLDMVRTEFETSALLADFVEATRVDYLFLDTPLARVRVDNLSPAYRSEADVQVYEMDKRFWLYQTGLETYTNGYVLHRRHTHQIRVPNFSEERDDGNVDYQAITAATYSQMMLTPENVRLRLGALMNQMAGYRNPEASEVQSGDDMAPLNLDWQAARNPQEGDVSSWEI